MKTFPTSRMRLYQSYPWRLLAFLFLPGKLYPHSSHSGWIIIIYYSCGLLFTHWQSRIVLIWRIEQIGNSHKFVIIGIAIMIMSDSSDTVGFHCLTINIDKLGSSAYFEFRVFAFAFYLNKIFPVLLFPSCCFFQLLLTIVRYPRMIEQHIRGFLIDIFGCIDRNCLKRVFLILYL